MIEIIRINSKYKKSISRLSMEEKAYVLEWIFTLSNWEDFEITDSAGWDVLELIHLENEKMCIKAIWKAKYDELTIGQTIGVDHRSKPLVNTKVKESNIKEVKVKESKITSVIETKVSETYWNK